MAAEHRLVWALTSHLHSVKPQVLADLLARSGFSPEAAAELHKSLYRQKLNQVGPGFRGD
jgi:hypothetical protein